MTSTAGYKEYHVKLFQNVKSEDKSKELQALIAGKLTNGNVNKVKQCTSMNSEANHVSFINKILKLTQDKQASYPTEEAAQFAAAQLAPVITACYAELGHPVLRTDAFFLANDGEYIVRYKTVFDTSD